MFDKPLFGCIMTNFDDTFGTTLLSGMLEHSDSKAHIIVKITWRYRARRRNFARVY